MFGRLESPSDSTVSFSTPWDVRLRERRSTLSSDERRHADLVEQLSIVVGLSVAAWSCAGVIGVAIAASMAL